jgi:hypothetical protein
MRKRGKHSTSQVVNLVFLLLDYVPVSSSVFILLFWCGFPRFLQPFDEPSLPVRTMLSVAIHDTQLLCSVRIFTKFPISWTPNVCLLYLLLTRSILVFLTNFLPNIRFVFVVSVLYFSCIAHNRLVNFFMHYIWYSE